MYIDVIHKEYLMKILIEITGTNMDGRNKVGFFVSINALHDTVLLKLI